MRRVFGSRNKCTFSSSRGYKVWGYEVRRPCFIKSDQKFVMPSFGVLTGGLDFSNEAFEEFHKCETQLFFLGERKIFKSSKRYL